MRSCLINLPPGAGLSIGVHNRPPLHPAPLPPSRVHPAPLPPSRVHPAWPPPSGSAWPPSPWSSPSPGAPSAPWARSASPLRHR